MLQKEVVDRITALPNTKDYGRLSVMTQFHCQVDKLFDVPPNAFKPAPKVTSAILHLSPHLKSPYQTCDTEKLMTVVTKAFSQRRKQLSNTLATLISKEALEDIQIDPSQRAENLSVESFVNITNALN